MSTHSPAHASAASASPAPVRTAVGTAPAGPARGQGLDSVLDMIDDVLAVDAQEFVRGFVQKGGQ